VKHQFARVAFLIIVLNLRTPLQGSAEVVVFPEVGDAASPPVAALRGVITDESGAIVTGAVVRIRSADGQERISTSDPRGGYSFSGLASTAYTVEVSAPGLSLPQPMSVDLTAGNKTLNIQLRVTEVRQQVTVADTADASVSVDPSNNAGATVLRGHDLDALADDPTNLESDLQALAGPAAGPTGGAIYVDGFSGGQVPSKDSIREIRINQNPFSPEYDKLGFGRIEIFTKPGTDQLHGSGFFNFGDDVLNSRNPYASEKAPFLLREYGGNVGGPLSAKASFFLDVRRDATNNGSIINAVTLNPETLAISPFNDFYNVLQRAIRVSPRIDYQINANNTLTVRYRFSNMDIPGAGIGGFNLASRGYDVQTRTDTVQVAETMVIGSAALNEARFQYFRTSTGDRPFTTGPAIQVLGSFFGGASNMGDGSNKQSNYEFQDYVSVSKGGHSLRFGARLRGLQETTLSPQNFNGTFSFNGGLAPQLDANFQPITDPSGQPILISLSSIEQYQRTLQLQQLGLTSGQIRMLGGGANQFTLTSGNAGLRGGQFDIGAFFGDDWRIHPNLTVSLGFRYETQTNIQDHRDFAPRVAIAWAPGAGNKNGTAHTVLRAGFGMFYDRFSLANTLNSELYNGIRLQQYVVTNPNFFPIVPPPELLAGLSSSQITQPISSSLRAPYIVQSAVSVERQLPWRTTASLTYANSHGLHLLRSRNINAPLPGTYPPGDPSSGVFPYGDGGPIFLTESAGLYNQNQLILNVSSRISSSISLTGSYMLNRALSNTDGQGTFPANQYTMEGEYGPTLTDVRNRFSLAGSLNTKWNLRVSPLIVLQSGLPFDITSGQDPFGTTLFNARPGIATDPNKPGVVETPYGLLDPNPGPDETILARNYGRGPGLVRVNLRISKTIGLGRRVETSASPAARGSAPGRGVTSGPFSSGGALQGFFSPMPVARRYNLVVSLQIENLINHNNPGPIIGNITSPLFGQANQPYGAGDLGGGGFSENANNRFLEWQVRFNF
jgi:hypothetical protein